MLDLDPEEIAQALGLLNLNPYYYHVRRYPENPSLFGARITGATYADSVLQLRTALNEQPDITLEGFKQLILSERGEIQIFADPDDDRPILSLETRQIDPRYTDALKGANERLGREELERPDGLE